MGRGPLDRIVGWPEAVGEAPRPGDLDQLFSLLASIQPGAWSMDRLQNEKVRRDSLALWIGQGPAVVAALLGRIILDEFHILDLATAVACRRRGLARDLLSRALGVATGQGRSQALLEIRASNQAAQQLYEEAGFVVVGSRPRYYRDGEAALLMTRPFDEVGQGAPDGESTL